MIAKVSLPQTLKLQEFQARELANQGFSLRLKTASDYYVYHDKSETEKQEEQIKQLDEERESLGLSEKLYYLKENSTIVNLPRFLMCLYDYRINCRVDISQIVPFTKDKFWKKFWNRFMSNKIK